MSIPYLAAPVDLDDGESVVIEAYRGIRLTIIPESGATVTVSKVDNRDASSHDGDSDVEITDETSYDVAWPFYRVSTADAGCRVALV